MWIAGNLARFPPDRMAGASGQSDLGVCSESEDGVLTSVECVEHIHSTKKGCVIEDIKQMILCLYVTSAWKPGI